MELMSITVLLILLFSISANNACWAFEENKSQRHKKFFLHKTPKDDNDILLKVIRTENEEKILQGCKVYKGKKLINKVLDSSETSQVKPLPEEGMQALLEDCKEFNLRKEFDKDRDKVTPKDIAKNSPTSSVFIDIPIFFPGTKWCGNGNISENYDDLGFDEDVDRCCRAHDCCDNLLPGETRGDIINTSWFTALSCECDHEFYDCLRKVNSISAKAILNIYLYVINKKCYELDYPLTEKCKRYYTFLKIKCAEYERNTTALKVYQWVPAKYYKNIAVTGTFTATE